MKIEFEETKYFTTFKIHPETPEEVASLYRMIKHSKKEIPNMWMQFHDKVYCNISMKKLDSPENWSISNRL